MITNILISAIVPSSIAGIVEDMMLVDGEVNEYSIIIGEVTEAEEII